MKLLDKAQGRRKVLPIAPEAPITKIDIINAFSLPNWSLSIPKKNEPKSIPNRYKELKMVRNICLSQTKS